MRQRRILFRFAAAALKHCRGRGKSLCGVGKDHYARLQPLSLMQVHHAHAILLRPECQLLADLRTHAVDGESRQRRKAVLFVSAQQRQKLQHPAALPPMLQRRAIVPYSAAAVQNVFDGTHRRRFMRHALHHIQFFQRAAQSKQIIQFPALIRIGLGVALLPYLCRKLGIERYTAVIEHKRLGNSTQAAALQQRMDRGKLHTVAVFQQPQKRQLRIASKQPFQIHLQAL